MNDTTVFRILGPLQIRGDAGPLHLVSHRQRVVLAMLLLEANRIIPVDRLIDAVWDDDPPATARSQIQICVSSIRRTLTEAGIPDAVTTRPPGYLLTATGAELDLHAFDQISARAKTAADAGDPVLATQLFREAIALRHGDTLAGIDSQLVTAAAHQINERVLGTLETCIDIELRLGRHHDLVGELMQLVNEHPLRERVIGHLMTALYRCGRQAEALGVYRTARDNLSEQHGLEPGDALRRLEHAILTTSPTLDLAESPAATITVAAAPAAGPAAPAPVVPQLLPADISNFAGRTDYIRILRHMLADVHNADREVPPIVAIAGRGGVGKTTLAVHLGHLLREHYPDGQLYAQMHGTESRGITAEQVLERFLRALGVPPPNIPDGRDERAELFRNCLAGRRVLVVLDDVASDREVGPLLPGSPTCGVIMTSRQRQTGIASARHFDLDVLDVDQALEMLSDVIGAERTETEPEAARELIDLCGRLPLAIRIAAARLAARPHWPIEKLRQRLRNSIALLDELNHHGLAVRPSIAVSYDTLDEDAKELFATLSILETSDFASWVGAPLLDRDVHDAEELLEMLVDVRLLDAETTGSQTRYHFHDLIRVYARERLVADRRHEKRRDALERTIGTWLYLAGAAHRRLYGGDYTVLHGAQLPYELPAPTVDHLLADPLGWFEAERSSLVAAIRQADSAGLDELCWDLAMTSVTIFEAHSHFDDWRKTHEIALAACRRAGNRRGEAAMLYSLGALSLVRQRFTEATSRLDQALAIFTEIDDRHGQALTLRNLAYLDRVRGDREEAMRRYQLSLAGLEASGDLAGQAHVLGGIAQIRLDAGEFQAAHALLTGALDIARLIGSDRVEAQVLFRLAETQREQDDLSGAETTFRSVLKLTRSTGDALGESYALYGLGQVHQRRMQRPEAHQALADALTIAERHGGLMLAARIRFAIGELCVDDDRLDDAELHFRTSLETFERLGTRAWHAKALNGLDNVHRRAAIPRQPGPDAHRPSMPAEGRT
jgi:DNA-binding SARP family transcriptional activator/tetratricopeptide (TPR) repeat protein